MSQSVLNDPAFEAMEVEEIEFDSIDGLLTPDDDRYPEHLQFRFSTTIEQVITRFCVKHDCSRAVAIMWALHCESNGHANAYIQAIVRDALYDGGYISSQRKALERIERQYAPPETPREGMLGRAVKWLTGYELKRKSA